MNVIVPLGRATLYQMSLPASGSAARLPWNTTCEEIVVLPPHQPRWPRHLSRNLTDLITRVPTAT